MKQHQLKKKSCRPKGSPGMPWKWVPAVVLVVGAYFSSAPGVPPLHNRQLSNVQTELLRFFPSFFSFMCLTFLFSFILIFL